MSSFFSTERFCTIHFKLSEFLPIRHLLVGRATRNCLSKGWDGRVPACEGAVISHFFPWPSEFPSSPPPPKHSRFSSSRGLCGASSGDECREDGTSGGGGVRVQECDPLQVSRGNPDWTKRHLVHGGRDLERPRSDMQRCSDT